MLNLLKVKDIASLYLNLKAEFNTIVALMYQGGENGKTKYLLENMKKEVY